MACDTDCRVDFDVTASLIDWQQHSDSLPLVTQDGAESKDWKPKPKPRSKSSTSDINVGAKRKLQKWKITMKGTGADDQQQLITETARDDDNDVIESRDVTGLSANDDFDRGKTSEQIVEDEVKTDVPATYVNLRYKEDAGEYSAVRDDTPEEMDPNYLTAIDELPPKNDSKENITAKFKWSESEIERSLQQAVEVINKKRTFLLKRLEALRKRKDAAEEKEREKSKEKTPIRVLKSPRASPVSHTDSEDEPDSVFVRKKVIKTDKRKMELKLLADIEVIVKKAESISWTVRKVNYMTPFLVAKIAADVDTDEETPDLVDVLSVTVGNKVIVMTTDFKNSCLKSFSHGSGDASSSVLKFDNSPWGITRMDHNTVAVSIPLANKLCLVDVQSGLKLKETVKTKKQYYGLVAIGTSILVATSPYSSSKSVDTIDLSGSILKTLVIDTLLQQPSFICSTPSGSFVVSDLSKGALLGVSNSLEIGSGFQLEGGAQLQSTRGVATNQDGDVFVVDYQQKKVKIFSSEGRFIKDFLTSNDGLKYPYGVCFDNRGHIYVTDGGLIKIFTY